MIVHFLFGVEDPARPRGSPAPEGSPRRREFVLKRELPFLPPKDAIFHFNLPSETPGEEDHVMTLFPLANPQRKVGIEYVDVTRAFYVTFDIREHRDIFLLSENIPDEEYFNVLVPAALLRAGFEEIEVTGVFG
jgi:hypothetical protein